MASVKVSIYQDTRYKKKSGLYPVKLRLYYDGQTRLYGIYSSKEKEESLDLSPEEFKKVMYSEKPRQDQKETRRILNAMLERAEKIVEQMARFDFDAFERRYTGDIGLDNDIIYQYKRYIVYLEKEERFGTASNYDLSLKSILGYISKVTGKDAPKVLPFSEITVEWLNSYEKYMLSESYSRATIGIYLRPLRAMFNYAMEPVDYNTKKKLEPIIDKDIYPFGERLYTIPTGSKVKKALEMEHIKALYNYPVRSGSDQEKARDFWFFSYVGNGMNMYDIARLKRNNIQHGVITFERAKTIRTTKGDPIMITVPVTSHIQHVLDKYGNKDKRPDSYLFSILSESMTAKEKRSKAQAFTRYINQHIKRLAEEAKIPSNISTNWGRHSFTTHAIRQGAAMEFIKDSLGHKNLKTTENYWGGFAENVKKDIAEGLMNFDK